MKKKSARRAKKRERFQQTAFALQRQDPLFSEAIPSFSRIIAEE
jgi:hypothetical protein